MQAGADTARHNLEAVVRLIINEALKKQGEVEPRFNREDLLCIPVGVSNRHVHLCRKDVDVLFGPGYELTLYRELSQKGFFAAMETVVVAGPKGAIPKVRLLGPLRKDTQVELLISDINTLGLNMPVRDSGVLGESPLLTIIGPKGTVLNNTGVMAAWRHIHMQTQEASALGLKEGDLVKVESIGERGLVFSNVRVRLGDEISTEFHIDIDEANAACLKTDDMVRIIVDK